MAHMSNRERIARAAEEARLTEAGKEAGKTAKKAAKVPAKSGAKRTAKPVRMKIVWDVCNDAGKAIRSFSYPDKAAAEAATEALTQSSGRTHVLRPTKVPMEATE